MPLIDSRVKGRKLEFTLRPPFDAFVKMDENGEWRTLVDRFRQIHKLRVVIIYQLMFHH